MFVGAEFLSLFLLVSSTAALGLSIVFDVGRVSAARTHATAVQRQIEQRKVALGRTKAQIAIRKTELAALQVRANEAVARRQRLQGEQKTLEFEKIEILHELGECDAAALGFTAALVVDTNRPESDRHDTVFSRQIWDFRNTALIWAGSRFHAVDLLYRTFTQASCVVALNLVPLAASDNLVDVAADEPAA